MAIINIPAPAGSALAGQIQMQSWQGLGQALGAYFGQKKQTELRGMDIRNLGVAQQSATATGLGQIPSWPGAMPQMQSRMGQQAQLGGQLANIFASPADPFTLAPGAGRFTGAGQLVAEREPSPIQPTQKAAQAKLDAYNKAKTTPIRERTKHQQAEVVKYELGQALVQIN